MICFAEAVRRSARPLVLFLIGTGILSAVYCQAPLYYSNQNQYFLHGLSDAGYGLLRDDWLANTRDSTPLFTALVAGTIRYLHPWAFYFYHALLLGAYAAAMLGLFVAIVGKPIAVRRWPIFVALFVAVHSALARWCSYRWLGLDYPWFLQDGLAGQYILGGMFQPSMFGVLLIVSVYLFVRGRDFSAAICAALAAVIHSTYLLPAGMLVLGMMTVLLVERRWGRRGQGDKGTRGQGEMKMNGGSPCPLVPLSPCPLVHALGVGVLALVLVLPILAYVLLTFGPTTASAFEEAQAILVDFRIPHHTRPDLWLDRIAVDQIVWVGLALILARPSRLGIVLAVTSLLALLLTLVQVATHSNTLALLFPWRVSSVLVPLATTVILSRLVAVLPSAVDGRTTRALSAFAIAVFVIGGVWISVARLGFHTNEDELPLLEFVRSSRAPGDVYFLPVKRLPPSRGSLSGDFKPLTKQQDARLIPIDLQRFRLYTGAPIFVDFKSIPYKDTEVLDWYTRFCLAEKVQEQIQDGRLTEALAELRHHSITHLVWPAGRNLDSDGLEKVHEDAAYQVYRLTQQ